MIKLNIFKIKARDEINQFKNKQEKVIFSENTIIGALAKYISTENTKFQPMNANFGILPKLEENIKDKKMKYTKLADRSLKNMSEMLQKCYK